MLGPDAHRMRLLLELRQLGVTDSRILAAIERTPRGGFVPEHLSALSWEDQALPLEGGQSLTKPSDAARMLSALGCREGDIVLEVGTGSGWQAAVLSRLAKDVVTLERRISLARAAHERLAKMALPNVAVELADGALGWPMRGPYDRIIVNVAIHTAKPLLLEQLKPGGLLVAPVGAGEQQVLTRVRVGEDMTTVVETLGPLRFQAIEVGLAP